MLDRYFSIINAYQAAKLLIIFENNLSNTTKLTKINPNTPHINSFTSFTVSVRRLPATPEDIVKSNKITSKEPSLFYPGLDILEKGFNFVAYC